jgi:peptidyl-tRNA hydrolase
MRDLRLYILMRNDLQSMGAGRAAAQASHASNAFIHKYGKQKDVKEWQKQTSQGFGTAIVLSGNQTDIMATLRLFEYDKKTPSELVVDPDYCIVITKEVFSFVDKTQLSVVKENDNGTVVVTRSEWTCAYIFGEKDALSPFLEKYPLYS